MIIAHTNKPVPNVIPTVLSELDFNCALVASMMKNKITKHMPPDHLRAQLSVLSRPSRVLLSSSLVTT